jgi:GT2 family glycosyltransferase
MRLSVLIACHNRREKTLECLRQLKLSAERADVDYQLVLFDDGSSDGTDVAVLEQEPAAIVLKGDGGYYWNRSMHAAFAHALNVGFSDYLWLNDDTILTHDAIEILNNTVTSFPDRETIVVGAVKDPITGEISYGGGRRPDPFLRPFHYVMVEPTGQVENVDVINGNIVWVTDPVARRLGNLDPVFEHAMGDTDYSLRARKHGVRIVQTADYIGSCSRNSSENTYKDKRLSLHKRLQLIRTRKGLPPYSWFLICARHGGLLWPLHFIWAYLKVVLNRS